MRHGLVLMLVCLPTFFFAIGRSAITDSDEAYYAEAAREMVVSGDWTTPHYNFEPRLQKPVLFYWLIAATYKVTGTTEAAARFWSALAGLGLAFVAAAVGRRWFGPGEGLLSGLIVATSFGVVPFARQSLPDMPLAFFVTLSTWAALEALRITPQREGQTGRPVTAWLLLASVAAALGMLDKGPVAIALPVTVVVPAIVWQGRLARTGWPEALRASRLVLAAVVFLLIAAPWYLAVIQAQGIGYAWQFFVGENVDRFATATYNQWRGWMYLPVIVTGLLPWSPFFLLGVGPIRDRLTGRRAWTQVEARLVCWVVGPLAFFMISVGSQPRYILPCLVPLAILLARVVWAHAVEATAARGRLFRWAAVVAAATMILVGVLLWRAAVVFQRAGADVNSHGPVVMCVVGVFAFVGACAMTRRHLPLLIAGSAAASLTVFAATLLSPNRPEPVEVVGAVLRAEPADVQVCSCGAFARSLNFYAQRPVVIANVTPEDPSELMAVLDRPARAVAAVDARTLAAIEGPGRRFPRLADVTYLNLGVWQRGATLTRPDPSWVQRVIVIANR